MDKTPSPFLRTLWRDRAAGSFLAVAFATGVASAQPLPLWAAGAGGAIPAQAGDAAVAVERAEFTELWQALRLSEVIAIMSREGLAYGAELGDDMFPTRAGASWQTAIARIYDPARMEREFRAGVAGALETADIAPMLAFFDSPDGRHITGLEISAREAMLDEAVEEASREAAQTLKDRNAPLYEAISDFVAANDLVDMNVAGAMNANLAFYSGLAAGSAFGQEMTESEILSDVWAQEPDIRAETEIWIYSYLALAYRPLPEGMLAEYTRFSRSDAGRVLNAALFAAFDTLFVRISHDLGAAAAARMVGEDL
jgi:hypothetical protein